MRVETQLKRRDRGTMALRDLYSSAQSFGLPSATVNERYNEILNTYCAKAPGWIRAYLDGYRAALNDQAYRQELCFGGFVDGRFYSTHRNRPDYYEANGISPSDYSDDGRVTQRGHYWIASVDAGMPKPFFVMESGQ